VTFKLKTRRLLAAAALLLAMSFALAACGSDQDEASSEDSAALSSDASGTSSVSEEVIEERSTTHPKFAPEGNELLAEEKVILQSALGVDLTHSSVTLPLHRGSYKGQTVWYVITESSDSGLANDLDVNFSAKLANMGIGCPKCVQEVTMRGVPGTPFGEAVVEFQGIPDFAPDRKLVPGTGELAFPPSKAEPGAVGGRNYSPFIRIKGSAAVYNAPIIAVGEKNFDVETHTDTADRVLSMKLPRAAIDTPSGQFFPGSVELLLVRGRQSGQEIFYMSTEASEEVAATLERATFVPALQDAPFLAADDFLGSARERIFLFTNGQTGADNPEAQGLTHLIVDGHATEDASLENEELLEALRNGGDTQNVLGDFPSLADPRHAQAYSPLWDAQIGEWTDEAVADGLNVRMDDENEILNMVKEHPELLRGPFGEKFGASGFVINCPTIAFTEEEPVVAQVAPVNGSQA